VSPQHVAAADCKVALCVTTYKRSWQLASVLPINLVCTWKWMGMVVWFLADLNPAGSDDRREVEKLVASGSCRAAAQCGFLRVFQLQDDDAKWKGWHASVAKNTIHRVAAELVPAGALLVNVDNDNLTPPKFVQLCLKDVVPKLKANGGEAVGASFKNPSASGTTGRVAVSSELFRNRDVMYDEDMYPSGAQDTDVIQQCKLFGLELWSSGGADVIGNDVRTDETAVQFQFQCSLQSEVGERG